MSEFTIRHESQPDPYEVLASAKDLLGHFGVEEDPAEEPEQFVSAIKQLDPRYQGERIESRQALEKDERDWSPETVEVINRTAQALRMVVFDEEGRPGHIETPLVGHYDAVIALGGARRSNLDRTRYAVDCLKDPNTTFNHLIVAGSGRPLRDGEQETETYAPGAQDQFDLCVGAAKLVARENPGLTVSVSYTAKEKAGTPDVLATVLADLQKSEIAQYGESSIAAITTQIYQVSTRMDLERVAKRFGITDVYVAGNPSDPELVAKRTPSTYLSEIIRTLKAAVMLIESENE